MLLLLVVLCCNATGIIVQLKEIVGVLLTSTDSNRQTVESVLT